MGVKEKALVIGFVTFTAGAVGELLAPKVSRRRGDSSQPQPLLNRSLVATHTASVRIIELQLLVDDSC